MQTVVVMSPLQWLICQPFILAFKLATLILKGVWCLIKWIMPKLWKVTCRSVTQLAKLIAKGSVKLYRYTKQQYISYRVRLSISRRLPLGLPYYPQE